jgi:TPR repeat protein
VKNQNLDIQHDALEARKNDDLKTYPLILLGGIYLGFKGFIKEGLALLLINYFACTFLVDRLFSTSEYNKYVCYTVIALVLDYFVGLYWNVYLKKFKIKPRKLNQSKFLNLTILSISALVVLVVLVYSELFINDLYLSYAKGLKEKGRKEDAYTIFHRLCSREMTEACINFGLVFDEREDEASKKIALRYFNKACKLDDGAGCSLVGLHLGNGSGVPLDKAKAFLFFKKACSLDNGYGCYFVGILQRDGVGTEVNHEKSFFSFQKSCSLNSDVGCNELAYSFKNGIGTIANNNKAMEYFKKSCLLGLKEACDK